MRGRGRNDGQHIERDERDNVMWRACYAERLEMQTEVRAVTRKLDDLLNRYEGMCWEHGLRDTSRNGTQGRAHAHAVWRLFRGIRNSGRNLVAQIVVG